MKNMLIENTRVLLFESRPIPIIRNSYKLWFQDVCKITIFYSDKMVERVTRTKNNNLAKFQVSESLCLAINNIDYVLQYIQPFVQVPFHPISELIHETNKHHKRTYEIPIKLALHIFRSSTMNQPWVDWAAWTGIWWPTAAGEPSPLLSRTRWRTSRTRSLRFLRL